MEGGGGVKTPSSGQHLFMEIIYERRGRKEAGTSRKEEKKCVTTFNPQPQQSNEVNM